MPDNQTPDFPSIAEVEEHIEKSSDLSRHKRPWTHWVIILLIVLIVGLAGSKAIQNIPTVLQSGKGSVSGTVVNALSTPVSADIFVLQSGVATTTGQNGSFVLRDIPTGTRQIIVGYDGMGKQIQVEVMDGQVVDLGLIKVETTQVAPAQ